MRATHHTHTQSQTAQAAKEHKKNDSKNTGNTIEIVYHEPTHGLQAEADTWPHHEQHEVPAAWEIAWNDYTWPGNDMLHPEQFSDQMWTDRT